MAKKNRKTLEAKFKNGRMPSENSFADLIDSTLNMIDDGFEKTVEDGFKISQLGDGKLISFYQNMTTLNPMWFINIDHGTRNLSIGNDFNAHVLTLCSIDDTAGNEKQTPHMGVGINKENPQVALDVAGTIASDGRMGMVGKRSVPADGNWHDITETLTGCHAYEVVAGVGGKDAEGKYALMHAFALNAYQAKNHITYHQAHFGAKCNCLELRWVSVSSEVDFEYKLQLRVASSYGSHIWVKYHTTKLWFDSAMVDSETNPDKESIPPHHE